MPIYKISTIIKEIFNNIPELRLFSKGRFEDNLNELVNTKALNMNACCVVISGSANVIMLIGDKFLKFFNEDEIKCICGHEYGHYKNTHSVISFIKILNGITKGKINFSYSRNDHDELEADLYGMKITSPDISIGVFKKFLRMTLYLDSEIYRRIKFANYVKKYGTDISVDEYLKNK